MKRPKVIQKVAIWPFFERTSGHEIIEVVRQITEMVGHITGGVSEITEMVGHITGGVSEITEMVGHITEGALTMGETVCFILESTAIWKILITLSRKSFSVNQQLQASVHCIARK
jgi:methyl-accepting chemotaxis protein